jgi:branched-chain amino acid transport system substrate-binding protein
MFRSTKHRLGALAVGLSAVLTLAACSSSDGSDTAAPETTAASATATAEENAAATCELPNEINLVSITDLTGPAAFAGTSAEAGEQLAAKEITEMGYLGEGVTLSIDTKDSAGSPETAAADFSAAASDSSIPAILGPISSGQAVAVAPLVEKSAVATVFTQAGSPGVVIGDYTFRMTPPMGSFYPSISSLLTDRGIKTMSIMYNNASPTIIDIAEQTLPALGEELGFKVLSSTGVAGDTQDLTAPLKKIADESPDAVALLLIGAQNPTAMTQLRQAGISDDVLIIGNMGAGGGSLSAAGAEGVGMYWPTIFNLAQTNPSTQDFIAKYEAEYGESPLLYAPERYDAVFLIADAIKRACSTDREAVRAEMGTIVAEGFTGAMGDLVFEGNDLRLPGKIVMWDGETEVLVD